jgi:hypothetical protein
MVRFQLLSIGASPLWRPGRRLLETPLLHLVRLVDTGSYFTVLVIFPVYGIHRYSVIAIRLVPRANEWCGIMDCCRRSFTYRSIVPSDL